MKDLKTIRGKGYLLELIAQGEHVQQDFKYSISDARKIARSISAFANNQGGRLLVGVKDNGVIAGVRNEEDIYVIEQAAEMYCRPAQKVEFTAYSCGDQGVVIRASIAHASDRPVYAQEPDRSWKAYYRVADENISAHPLMVRTWRLMASGRHTLMHLDGPEYKILNALSTAGFLTFNQALLTTGASRRMAESAIVRLGALGMIDYEYHKGEFVITAAE